ncbi:hypothetical protein Ancab_035662, partial [Ancistrocladus abbreviatus]
KYIGVALQLLAASKMVISVEVTSREMIKPKTPTPHHLRTLKLSFFDQLLNSFYVPFLFFYGNENTYYTTVNNTTRSQLLKQSLSSTLVQFYPLAGRVDRENPFVDCNDEGVEYFEANVFADISKVVEDPNIDDLKVLLPFAPYNISKNTGLGIQMNYFGCGGIAIGLCASHRIADGTALCTFMNAWAATARGVSETILQPEFNYASHFPPRDLKGMDLLSPFKSVDKIVTRRFIFNKEKLNMLKEKAIAAEGSQVKDPTKVEVVSAFIWKQIIEVDISSKKFSAAIHVVNLRPRVVPPFPEGYFGNFFWVAAAPVNIGRCVKYHELVAQLRYAIRLIDNEYVKAIRSEECLNQLKDLFDKLNSDAVKSCVFSSWCRFPFYEVDFGWGKPTWFCPCFSWPLKNAVILASTKDGDGIEAWVNMLEEEIPALERDYEAFPLASSSV